MIIAVNTRCLAKDEWDASANFVYETFSRITKLHPEHTFIFIYDRQPAHLFKFPANVVQVSSGRPAMHPVQWYIWYNIKVPAVLKKYKAEIFVSPDGVCSLATKVPQCLLVPDLTFLNEAPFMPKAHLLFYKSFMPRCIKKSKVIITSSQFVKSNIVQQYKTNADKVQVIFSGSDEKFMPVNTTEREHTKAKYAAGNEYFIYTGEIGSDKNLLNLLKAFSAFKKRQKSNMQLLIAGTPGWKQEDFLEDLRLFRFKQEVKLLNRLTIRELVPLVASAYAMVNPALSDKFGRQYLQAMRSGVPVITSAGSAASEICGDAALYADPKNFKEIAIQMMLIYKDENLRSKLIVQAKLQAEKFTWDIAASRFWNVIEQTIAE